MFSPPAIGERMNRYHEMSVPSISLQGHSAIPIDISAMKTSTWTYKPAPILQPVPILTQEKHLRFRAEKSGRRPLQRLQWRRGKWSSTDGQGVNHLDLSMVGSMTIADVSPKFAVKRIVMLHENSQYKEAANFINRLNHGTFKVILHDLPVDVLIDSMPGSCPLLESLYAKVFLSDGLDFSLKTLRPESVILQMVKSFAEQDGNPNAETTNLNNNTQFVTSCKKLIKVIIHAEPKIKQMLITRKKVIEKAIEGMGHHGMVGNADGSMMNLHDALKIEFQRVVASYKSALEKLQELSLSSSSKQLLSRTVSHGPAPIQVSHQRQLNITQQEIQERLIKNKTILNVVEPILGNHSLDVFLGILQRRIDYDKDCLFQFTQLKKEIKLVEQVNVVTPVLMRYSQGIDQVLKLMKEITGDLEESEGSDISGYHSDSDSVIMTSGNSPYVSKSARYNFLYRSVRATPMKFRGVIPSFSTCTPSVSVGSGPSTASDTPSEGGKSLDVPTPPSPPPSAGTAAAIASTAASTGQPDQRPGGQKSRPPLQSARKPSDHGRQAVNENPAYIGREPKCIKGQKLSLVKMSNSRSEYHSGEYKSMSATSTGGFSTTATSDQRETAKNTASSDEVLKLKTNFRPDNRPSIAAEFASAPSCLDRQEDRLSTPTVVNNVTKIRVDGSEYRAKPAVATESTNRKKSTSNMNFRSSVAARSVVDSRMRPLAETSAESLSESGPSSCISPGNKCFTGKSFFTAAETESDTKTFKASSNGTAEGISLARRYALLYTCSRANAMEALDALPELRESDELKSKLLFSIVVLSFRAATTTRHQVGETVRRQLQIPPPPPAEHRCPPGRQAAADAGNRRSQQLHRTLTAFLQQTVDSYDLTACVDEVCRQIWATLYDYPCLRSSEGLLSYIKECVRLSWSIINQECVCRIEYEQRSFSDDLHVRQSGSDPTRTDIVSYVWPALIDESIGCVSRAVVIT